MKKLFSLLLAAVMGLAIVAPSNATLANSSTYTRYGTQDVYSALITATANDTTASTTSNTIANYDNKITHIGVMVKVTNQTGTSPTLQLQLLGSFDGSNFYVLQSKQGSTAGTTANMQTSALDISAASTTTVVGGFSTDQFNRTGGFPPYLKVKVIIGGSSTPGGTYVVSGTFAR